MGLAVFTVSSTFVHALDATAPLSHHDILAACGRRMNNGMATSAMIGDYVFSSPLFNAWFSPHGYQPKNERRFLLFLFGRAVFILRQ